MAQLSSIKECVTNNCKSWLTSFHFPSHSITFLLNNIAVNDVYYNALVTYVIVMDVDVVSFVVIVLIRLSCILINSKIWRKIIICVSNINILV